MVNKTEIEVVSSFTKLETHKQLEQQLFDQSLWKNLEIKSQKSNWENFQINMHNNNHH